MKHDIKALNPASWKYRLSTYLGDFLTPGFVSPAVFFDHFTQTDIFLGEPR